MIGPLGRLGAVATLGQHCPQMTQRRCTPKTRTRVRAFAPQKRCLRLRYSASIDELQDEIKQSSIVFSDDICIFI